MATKKQTKRQAIGGIQYSARSGTINGKPYYAIRAKSKGGTQKDTFVGSPSHKKLKESFKAPGAAAKVTRTTTKSGTTPGGRRYDATRSSNPDALRHKFTYVGAGEVDKYVKETSGSSSAKYHPKSGASIKKGPTKKASVAAKPITGPVKTKKK